MLSTKNRNQPRSRRQREEVSETPTPEYVMKLIGHVTKLAVAEAGLWERLRREQILGPLVRLGKYARVYLNQLPALYVDVTQRLARGKVVSLKDVNKALQALYIDLRLKFELGMG